MHDLVIRNGTIADGSGGDLYEGDVAIAGGRIAALGGVAGRGREEIDAQDLLVTPGFVDIHTHYDGQVTWEETLAPSSQHGVTTVLTGNCGVGFAPVRSADRDMLIKVMEGVEDIPELVMSEGIPWNWESFPQYLDALAQRRFDIDVATQLAHSPLRVYVMGARGAAHEPSTQADRAQMRGLVAEAVRAGAFGVTTSRSMGHRLKNGELAPSVTSTDEELLALAAGLRDADAGVYQLITEASASPQAEFAVVREIARTAGRPVSFTLLQAPRNPSAWQELLRGLEQVNDEGLTVRGQVFPRPVGVLMGLDLSLHPLCTRPSYQAVRDLPLRERVAILRQPEFKARLLRETAIPDPQPMNNYLLSQAASLSVLDDPVDYAPHPDKQLGARAAALGVSVESLAYDLLLEKDGAAILYLPGANFVGSNLAAARAMLEHPHTVLGLGDGGAHYGFICDASFTTYTLTHWARDVAAGERFSVPWAVAALSQRPAAAVGLSDRGQLRTGYKADINIIDHDRLQLFAPRAVRNLPAGGRRLEQSATGYVATLVDGVPIYRNGESTGARPGRLVRSGTVERGMRRRH